MSTWSPIPLAARNAGGMRMPRELPIFRMQVRMSRLWPSSAYKSPSAGSWPGYIIASSSPPGRTQRGHSLLGAAAQHQALPQTAGLPRGGLRHPAGSWVKSPKPRGPNGCASTCSPVWKPFTLKLRKHLGQRGVYRPLPGLNCFF